MNNILDQINGSHWLMRREAVEEVATFLQQASVAQFNELATRNRGVAVEEGYSVENGVAVVPVLGKIFPRANLMTRASGGTSAEMLSKIIDRVEEDEDVRRVVFQFDSPGGTGTRLPGVAQKIRKMEKPTTAFAEGGMHSAAYLIGTAADRVVLSPMASVGSIGVYTMLVSKKKRLEDEGFDVRIVRSTPKKGLQDPAEPITEKSVKLIQKEVNALHTEFARQVALNLNLSQEQVTNEMADASTHTGENAVENGFADEVMTYPELIEEEFSLNEESELDETEQTLNFLTEQYSNLRERHQNALNEVRRLNGRIRDLEDEVTDQREQEIEKVLTRAIDEQNKIRKGRRDELRTKLEEDFEATTSMLDMIEEGAAAPSGELQEDTDMETHEEAIQKLEDEGMKVAFNQAQADTYRALGWVEGENFVMAENVEEYLGTTNS